MLTAAWPLYITVTNITASVSTKTQPSFLYVLRLIYEEQMEKLSIHKEVMTSVGEVVEKMHYLGLWNGNLLIRCCRTASLP